MIDNELTELIFEYERLHPKAESPSEYLSAWNEELKEMLKNANGRQIILFDDGVTDYVGELIYI
tara:strand:+ start:5555 stop:5746 length:192 start_codon:yes stop_codon:yes gene_type:complete